MCRFTLFIFLASFLLLSTTPAHAERRVALVIGNGSYPSAPLKNPVNDAKDMAVSLQRLGFEVVLLTNANQQQMDSSVREFGIKLRQGGAGLFYYAGHGLQVGGENYLVPVNANIQSESDVRFTCLPAGMILGKMEDARNDLNIIILDACRNNPFARSFRSSEQGLAKMDAPTGSLISYATAPGSVAADGQGRNGLFTQHLLRNMGTPSLSVEEMFKRVRQSVVAETNRKQVPWEASSLIGQFYFSGSPGLHTLSPMPLQVEPQVSAIPTTMDLKSRVAGRYTLGNKGIKVSFVMNGEELSATAQGGSPGNTKATGVTDIKVKDNTLFFRVNYRQGIFGIGGDAFWDFSCLVSGNVDTLPCFYKSHRGEDFEGTLSRIPGPPQ